MVASGISRNMGVPIENYKYPFNWLSYFRHPWQSGFFEMKF
jgi:hypothetical protein